MVGGLGDDESFAAGRDFGDPQRQIVGLAAGAGEDDLTDRRGEGRQKPLGIGVDAVVQIARVDVELGDLPTDRLDHARMAMSDRWDIVVDVEVATPFRVIHPDAFGPDHSDRLFIEENRLSAEMAQALPDSLAQRGTERARGLWIEGVQRQNFLFLLLGHTLTIHSRVVLRSSQNEGSSTTGVETWNSN